jgi:hypothetical protein
MELLAGLLQPQGNELLHTHQADADNAQRQQRIKQRQAALLMSRRSVRHHAGFLCGFDH